MAVTGANLTAVLPDLSDDDATALAAASTDLVSTYLRGGTCPTEVADHATIRLARYLQCVEGESGGRLEQDGIQRPAAGVGNALHRSGAAQLLAYYRGVRVATARADADD